jgi:hypothetical protein
LKNQRIIKILCLIIIALLTAVYFKPIQTEETGIQINNWSTALGTVDDNMDKTRVTYSIDITNFNPEDIYVISITLETDDKLKDKILDGDRTIMFDKVIKKGETTQVKGEIIINTKGMDKTQTSNLEPIITGVRVKTEEVIDFTNK